MADAQILTTTWKLKNTNLLLRQQMSSFRVTIVFKDAHSDESLLLAAKEAILLRITLLFTDSR